MGSRLLFTYLMSLSPKICIIRICSILSDICNPQFCRSKNYCPLVKSASSYKMTAFHIFFALHLPRICLSIFQVFSMWCNRQQSQEQWCKAKSKGHATNMNYYSAYLGEETCLGANHRHNFYFENVKILFRRYQWSCQSHHWQPWKLDLDLHGI